MFDPEKVGGRPVQGRSSCHFLKLMGDQMSEQGIERIKAPFTVEQVKGLNSCQHCDEVHPFTCGYCDDEKLVATLGGWICPLCDYTQGWAWAWMAACTSLSDEPNDALKRARERNKDLIGRLTGDPMDGLSFRDPYALTSAWRTRSPLLVFTP